MKKLMLGILLLFSSLSMADNNVTAEEQYLVYFIKVGQEIGMCIMGNGTGKMVDYKHHVCYKLDPTKYVKMCDVFPNNVNCGVEM